MIMKTVLKTSIAAILSFAAAPALAQGAGSSGFDPYGYVSLNYLDSTGGSSGSGLTYGVARGGFRWDFGGNFGIDYGVFAFGDENDTISAHYLALAYNFGDLRLSAGAPVPAFDTYGKFRITRQLPLYDVYLGPYVGSYLTFVDLQSSAGSSDQHTYGLRADGVTGGLSYAVSIHGVTDVDDVFALSSSAQYVMQNDVTLTGGLEYINVPSGGDDLTKVKLGVAKDFGKFDAAFNAAYLSGIGTNVTVYELSGSYDFNDKFNVGASVFGATETSELSLVAIDASYKFYANASLTASIVQSTNSGGSDGIYNIGLRYDF